MSMPQALYEMEVKTQEKIFLINLQGFFELSKAEQFPSDFEAHVGTFDPTQYSLLIDCTNLSVFKPEVLPVLEGCYQLYMSKNFKHIIFVNPIVATCKSQLKRVGKNVNLVADFVDTFAEAVAIAKS